MGDIVNLRRARRAKARADAAAVAGENRIRSGRTKAQKTALALEAERSGTRLDGHFLGRGDVPGRPADPAGRPGTDDE